MTRQALPYSADRLLAYLADLARGASSVRTTVGLVAQDLGLSVRTVQAAQRRAEAAGLLRIESAAGSPNRYWLRRSPTSIPRRRPARRRP